MCLCWDPVTRCYPVFAYWCLLWKSTEGHVQAVGQNKVLQIEVSVKGLEQMSESDSKLDHHQLNSIHPEALKESV